MLFKYCDPRGIDILINKRLKASKIHELNDPFELAFGVESETAVQNLNEEYLNNPRILGFWKRVLRSQGVKFNNKKKFDIIKKAALFQAKDLDRVGKSIQEDLFNKMGVICLTDKPSVIQMWAHYTANHSGLVVGLHEPDFIKDPRALVKVTYTKTMPLLPVTGDVKKFAEYENLVVGLLGRKEEKWEYENESRLYLNFNKADIDGNYYSVLPPEAIREVYLGLNSREELLSEVETIKSASLPSLKIFQMVRHPTEYKLVPKLVS